MQARRKDYPQDMRKKIKEWVNNIPVCVKSVKIDGKKIKANVFYQLKNGKFIEVKA